MKNLLFSLMLICSTLTFAQKSDALTYTIKKENNQEIKLTLPTGTVINPDGKITIDQWQVNIETVATTGFDNDTIPAKNKEVHILTNYSLKDLTIPNEDGEINITASEFRHTPNGIFVVAWTQKFNDGPEPEKLIAARLAGDYILTLSIANNTDTAELAKKQLVDILDRATVTQNGKPLPKS